MGQKVNPHGLRVGVIKDWDPAGLRSQQAFGDTWSRITTSVRS